VDRTQVGSALLGKRSCIMKTQDSVSYGTFAGPLVAGPGVLHEGGRGFPESILCLPCPTFKLVCVVQIAVLMVLGKITQGTAIVFLTPIQASVAPDRTILPVGKQTDLKSSYSSFPVVFR
jgi:hypothetical protein